MLYKFEHSKYGPRIAQEIVGKPDNLWMYFEWLLNCNKDIEFIL